MEVGPPSYNSNPTMLNNIDSYLHTLQSSSNTPDIVLFHMGTNDIDNSDSPSQIAGQLYQVCTDHLLNSSAGGNPNAEIFLAKIIANYYDYSNTTYWYDETTSLNNEIGSDYDNTSILPSAQKKKIQLVDMQSDPQLVYTTDFSTNEGGYAVLHPKPSGYLKIAQHWFAVMQAYYQPILTGPADNATNRAIDVSLSWNTPQAVTDNSALTYELQISTVSDFSSTVYDNSSISSASTSINSSGLKYGTKYYWRVRITNYGWSNVRNFTTLPMSVYVKVFLQGPYVNTPTPHMSTNLRGLLDFPLSQPYNVSPWSYTGSESVGSVPLGVVDWVLVQLRTGTAPGTAVQTCAAFLMSDGSIQDIDGSDHVNFIGLSSGSYYIVVIHRNHLAVMSANPVSLPNGSAYDFTTSESQAYIKTVDAIPMASLVGGKYGMYDGDVNGNGTVKYNLSGNDRVLIYAKIGGGDVNATISGYYNEDVNLDGVVKYNLSNNDSALIYGTIGAGDVNATVSTQVP